MFSPRSKAPAWALIIWSKSRLSFRVPRTFRLSPKCATYLGDMRPATTLVVVQALARPIYLIEVEATAARD